MIKSVIFDIDGTLADDSHRLEKATNSDGELDLDILFDYDLVKEDPPLEYGIYNPLVQVQPCDRIIFVTGRPERLRPVTQWWIQQHFCKNSKFSDWCSQHGILSPSKFVLCMRPDSVLKENNQVKRDILTHCHNTFSDQLGGSLFIAAFDNVSVGSVEERISMYEEFGARMFYVDNKDFWNNFDWSQYHNTRRR